jgi:hypothetical protein
MIFVEKLHLFSCLFMVGVIWKVQIVQYPSFHLIPEEQFKIFHEKHSNRISYIVAPAMLLELICAYWLYYVYGAKYIFDLASIVLIFIMTAFISVPLHNTLSLGKNDKTIDRLITTNWFRTVLWTAKLLILFFR